MLVIKNLSYALLLVSIGSFLAIIANSIKGADSAQKGNIEEKWISSSSPQEGLHSLRVTGRRELNGFKGYRNYRRGYRKYIDNWWYPETAFSASEHLNAKPVLLKERSASKSALFVSSLEERKLWMSKQHIDSCTARYRSYDQNDNSYQPFHGPRRQCFSHIFKKPNIQR
ncbi:BA14K family protein [Bartonella sp. B10]